MEVSHEKIGGSPEGAPSKRIISIIGEYDKVTEGNIILLQNGIEVILEKCPRFQAWMETLIRRCLE